MSTSTTDLNCPSILPVPFTITVNTSGTTPDSVDGHPAATTHAGFTRISKFTLTPVISATDSKGIEGLFPNGVSNRLAKWDFGDGYTLSGADAFIQFQYFYMIKIVMHINQRLQKQYQYIIMQIQA